MAKNFYELNQFPANRLMVTVNVRFTKMFRFRIWAGKQLIRLVAWLWNSDVEFTLNEIERGQ